MSQPASELEWTISVTYKGKPHHVTTLPTSLLHDLQLQIAQLSSVPPSHQKLIFRGKKAHAEDGVTVEQAGLTNGVKVTVLGPTEKELDQMQAAEREQHKRESVLRKRAAQTPTKVYSSRGRVSSLSSTSSSSSPFHSIKPLSHLPNPSQAQAFLNRLAADPSIVHVMHIHDFQVGVLTELAPHEQPHLLGLNVNKGQEIKLRIRTDRYDGFRNYNDVRKVLCHELTHNVWGDHDNNFKQLNSTITKQVIEHERIARNSAHTLAGEDVYEPEEQDAVEVHEYVLGGPPRGAHLMGETVEARRARMLDAAERRQREEEAMEQSCGTTTGTTTTDEGHEGQGPFFPTPG